MTIRPDFSALFTASPYPYLLVDTGFIIIGANPAYLRATGRSADDIVGKHIFDAFPANPADPDATNLIEVRNSIERAITTQKPHTCALLRYAIPRETPEGTVFDERYWSVVHTPVFDENGNVSFVAQNAIDVTDLYRFDVPTKKYYLKQDANAVPDAPQMNRPQMHEAMTRILNAERGQLQMVFDQAPGFIVILNGKEHVFEMANEAYYQLVGHRDIIGKPAMEALPELVGQGFKELLDGAYASGDPVVLKERKVTLQRKLNGPQEDRYVDLLFQPIVGPDGQVTGIFAQGSDVTQAHQTTLELRAERDQSQYIFDSMAEGFAVLDRHWTVLQMNAEGLRITQRSAAEVIGRNHWDLFPELSGTDTEVIYRHVMETGKSAITEIFYTWPDNKQAWMEIRAHRSLEGGIAFFFRDVTERRMTEEKLKDADQRKDEFLAMLAHELRNPLAPIGAAAQLLQLAKLDDARVRQTSQIIGRQVDHMTHLINDLLDVSRVTRGLVTLENAPLDIRHIVTDAVEQATPLIQSKGHHLTLQLAPDTTMVIGDKKRMVQVITNILNNAAKYTNAGGNILLKTDVSPSHVQIDVVDNGVGMSADLAEHAFDLFAQAKRTSDRSAGGLGLGLALVKSLVDLHGGTVTCSSEGMGYGSRFTVCLPRLPGQDRALEHSYSERSTQQSAKSLRILIVDDNVDAASMLAMLLEASGHQVMVEHQSERALARAKTEAPDVCLLDIGLPEMDGNELAQRLRALPETTRSVLVAVTGYGQENDHRRTRAAGFDHHLVKPLDTKKLVAILDRV